MYQGYLLRVGTVWPDFERKKHVKHKRKEVPETEESTYVVIYSDISHHFYYHFCYNKCRNHIFYVIFHRFEG